MNEFKGTKGKWIKSLSKKNSIVVRSEDGFKVNLTFGKISGEDCTIPTCCKTEQHANALLVSKAPEMLEMLKTIDQALDELWQRDDKNVLFDYLNGIDTKQLIKEATELK